MIVSNDFSCKVMEYPSRRSSEVKNLVGFTVGFHQHVYKRDEMMWLPVVVGNWPWWPRRSLLDLCSCLTFE